MRDNHNNVKKDKKRWRVILVRILVLCMLLPCMHMQAFAASQTISNGYYMIQSGNSSSKVLDINNWNLNDGGNLEIYQKNQTTNQIFYIQFVKTQWNWRWGQFTQYYTIRCLHSGKYIHTADGRYTNANVHQWSGCNTDNALWGLRSAGSGHYYFMNKASGACLDNSGGKAVNANNVITYSWNRSYAQQWKPISVSKTGFGGNISNYTALSGKYTTSDTKTVTGNASMTYPVTKVQIGIFNESGKYIRGTYLYPNYINYSYRYTFSFSGLTKGRYYFRVRMWNVWGEITRTNASYFNVVEGDVYKNNGVPKYPSNRASAVTPGIINRASNRNRTSYNNVINQFRVTTTSRYKRTSNATYCNIFAWDVMSAMDVQLPHWTDANRHKPVAPFSKNANEQRANDVYRWLAKYGSEYGWYSVSASLAQSRANNGYPTIAIWKNPKESASGHVMVVRPEAGNYLLKNGKGPVIAQAGASNYDYTYVKSQMGDKAVMYYTHN